MSRAAEGRFPTLPTPGAAPAALREALARDTQSILAGHWRAFGHLDIKVDDPPRWHRDYLAKKDLATDLPAFQLDHRSLPGGADIKLIWELSRWYALVRLAMAAYVLGDERAAAKCVAWLADWVDRNRPYRGWNWTSALESGLRLVQFTWIDALLEGYLRSAGGSLPRADRSDGSALSVELGRVRDEVLPAHARFAWRYRSVGSSANNHLIGELAGLILAVARWPELERWASSLERLQALWEREVLAQFASDGGNAEQALHYHRFSFEFCWQARAALLSSGRKISDAVEGRLGRAARFFWEAQARREPWDYGDSDNALVTPFFLSETTANAEVRDWLRRASTETAVEFWLGDPPVLAPALGLGPPAYTREVAGWWVYPDTGIALCESGYWWLRWDLSPLGYLKTAAHGHLDALHLSIWYQGVALVIDPGTGSYYADTALREWLASRESHNGPCPASGRFPHRLGPFLWSAPHAVPRVSAVDGAGVGRIQLPGCAVTRRVTWEEDRRRCTVSDCCRVGGGKEMTVPFTVHWQFAPGAIIKRRGARCFVVNRGGVDLEVEAGPEWAEATVVETESEREKLGTEHPLAGVVSPAFRCTTFAPYLRLQAGRRNDKPCLFRTTFLASRCL